MRSPGRLILIPICLCALALSFSSAHAGVTTLVSVASDGTAGIGDGGWSWSCCPDLASPSVAMDSDGQYVVFSSFADDLVSGDTNAKSDVFLRDRIAGVTIRVSVATDGAQGNGNSGSCSISSDGRFVAFVSQADNLVPGDTNGCQDVFIHDRLTGQTTRVSVSSDGTQSNEPSGDTPAITPDGRFVAFGSWATNLAPGVDSRSQRIYVHDRQSGQTDRVSNNSCGWLPCISSDGRYIAYSELCGHAMVYRFDRSTRERITVSIANDGSLPNTDARTVDMSADGRYVYFNCDPSNYLGPAPNMWSGLYARDCVTGDTTVISTVRCQAVSGDGRFIASRIGYGPVWQLWVQDRVTCGTSPPGGCTEIVSLSSDGAQGIGDSGYPTAVSADGRFVAFASTAANLVPGVTNGNVRFYLRDRHAVGAQPPPGSGPGWNLPPGTVPGVRNPYAGYVAHRRAKGQLHCHYYQDAEHEWGPAYIGALGYGSWYPSALVGAYAALGYDFVCLTEHNHCTSDPVLPLAHSVAYCEEVTRGFGHVLALGTEKHGSSLPRWDEKRYLPWDVPNDLREVVDGDPQSVRDVVSAIHSPDYGNGVAIVAHPSSRLYPVTESAIRDAGPDGVSVYTAASFNSGLDRWKQLLESGTTASTANAAGKKMLLFGATEDDFTPVVGYQGFGRTWVVADLISSEVTDDAIFTALRMGRYWSYWSYRPHYGAGPLLSLSVSQPSGLPVISVTSDTSLDEIKFYGATSPPSDGPLPGGSGSGTSASYTCNGTEKYVRVEARKGDIHIYSQAIAIDWQADGSGMSASMSSVMRVPFVGGSPSDILYTPAQPEELPAKMPPLGYIGRAYNVSTTSGTYPPDATLTLSYEGIDVAPHGTSNLAVYRWDALTDVWVKLTSTVDIGNALVTAPLAQQGLCTISAQVTGDTTAPTVTIHTPSNGATLTGPDVIGVQASDNVGVLRTSFYLNDQCIGVDSAGWDGYTCQYDYGKKSAGAYTLKVVAEDVTGNTGQAQITVNIASSGVAPTVTLASPSNGAVLTGTATLTGTCADNSLVAGVFILVDGIPVGEATVTGDNWAFDLDTNLLANGSHALAAQAMDDDQNTFEQGIGITVAGPTLGSLAAAKDLADGAQARLSGRVVTFGDPGYEGAFWIEELNRFAAIRVQGSLIPSEGDMVSASGLMSTVDGERTLVGADVLQLSASNPLPRPIGMPNRAIGGGPFGLYIPGIKDAKDLTNLGLLITTWGKVTHVGEGYLYIDDGSGLRDGTSTGAEENVGVRVVCNPTGYLSGEKIEVTGISSCFWTPSGTARRILTRKPEDVRKLTVR